MTEAKRQRADMSKGMLSERGTGRAARSFLKHKQPHPWGGKQQGSMVEHASWKCACGWVGSSKALQPNPSGGNCCPTCGGSGGLVLAAGSMVECADLMATRDLSVRLPFSKEAFGHAIKYDPDGWNPRFDGSGRVVHHVKDGRPLTKRGAELLKQKCSS